MLQTFHICPICKLPGFREQHLCRHCAWALKKLHEPVFRPNPEYTVRSLFSWDKHSPQGVRDLVYALKGVEESQSWLELALWMTNKFPLIKRRPVLIPVPGSRPNHAYGLGAALSRVLGFPLQDALVPVTPRRQKSLGREERNRIEFTLRSSYLCMDYRDVIIVDDVVTTGATARAAFEALQRPNSCEVWCLVDRRPCGP